MLRLTLRRQYETPILSSHLSDRLEWDLASRLTPEEFARGVARDLGLTGEALPLISNAVREQIMRHRRSALELQLLGSGRQWAEGVRMLEDAGRLERGEIVDLPDDTVDAQGETQEPLDPVRRAAQLRYEGHAILNDLAFRGPKPLEGVWREFGAPFGPVLQELNTEERERSFVEYMRELRCVTSPLRFACLLTACLLQTRTSHHGWHSQSPTLDGPLFARRHCVLRMQDMTIGHHVSSSSARTSRRSGSPPLRVI